MISDTMYFAAKIVCMVQLSNKGKKNFVLGVAFELRKDTDVSMLSSEERLAEHLTRKYY